MKATHPFGRPWTPAEDASLRSNLERVGTREMAKRLGRSVTALRQRAAKIGARTIGGSRRPHWNDIQRRRLKNLWGEYALRYIAERVGHSANATRTEAGRLGLPSVPAGMELLQHAADRAGLDRDALKNILEWHGVEIHWPLRYPTKHPRTFLCVDSFEVDEAVKAWVDSETLKSAASRIGRSPQWLARRLRGVEGVPPKETGKHWRIPSSIIDRVVGQGRRVA